MRQFYCRSTKTGIMQKNFFLYWSKKKVVKFFQVFFQKKFFFSKKIFFFKNNFFLQKNFFLRKKFFFKKKFKKKFFFEKPLTKSKFIFICIFSWPFRKYIHTQYSNNFITHCLPSALSNNEPPTWTCCKSSSKWFGNWLRWKLQSLSSSISAWHSIYLSFYLS